MSTDNRSTMADAPSKKKRSTEGRARRRTKTTPVRSPVKNVLEDSRQSSLQPTSGRSALQALGIELNSTTARQAVILSEIIGKPVSQRGRRR